MIPKTNKAGPTNKTHKNIVYAMIFEIWMGIQGTLQEKIKSRKSTKNVVYAMIFEISMGIQGTLQEKHQGKKKHKKALCTQ